MTRKAAPVARQSDAEEKEYWWKREGAEKVSCLIPPRPGHDCPECGEGTLAYDGLFILTCDCCGHIAESGASW